tara:strand:+ start:1775 stop:2941 length:1167 start_codon:yes stop_codon:yes gene_type:complete
MSSYLLSDGLNKIDKLNAEPTGDVGIRPNTGETGVYFYEKNFRVYTRDSSTSAWSEDTSSGDNSGSYVSKLVSWTGVDRIYVRTLDGVSDISGDTRVYPRSENISTPAPAGVAYTTIETLSDVPDYAAADAGKYLAINSSGDEIEFVDAPSGGGGSVTYSTSDEFVFNFAEYNALGVKKGSISMTDANAKDSSGNYYTYTDASGSTVTGSAVSIPSGSRIVGMVWTIATCFKTSGGSASLSGLIEFGDEGVLFPVQGGYDYTSFYPSNAYSINSGYTYKIATVGDFNWAGVGGPSSPSVGETFTATSSDYNFSSSSSVAYEGSPQFGSENGSTQLFTHGDGETPLSLVSGGINHVPDVSGAIVPKIRFSGYDALTLTEGVIGVKFIYI